VEQIVRTMVVTSYINCLGIY